MQIRYRDLSVASPELRQQLLDAVGQVLDHGILILGPEVAQFEEAVAAHCGTRFAVGMNSGTDALYLTLRALGIGPCDEVITTPLSWIATTNAIALTGATPVFVDVREDLNLDPELVEAAVTPRTRAILPVHFTGHLCEMDRIGEVARRRSVPVVEDAAQAFGAHDGTTMAGGFGVAGCFSMNPMKVFAAYGEAGAVVTDDADLAEKLRSLAYAGTINKEDCHTPSLNGRLDTVQAAMMLVALPRLNLKLERLREIAAYFDDRLQDVVVCPPRAGTRHVYYSYTILAERRAELIAHLATRGVEVKIQHPILMPYHTAYRDRMPRPRIPVAEKVVEELLCIPSHEKLSDAQVEHVAASVRSFYR